jgi:hypothetical protein
MEFSSRGSYGEAELQAGRYRPEIAAGERSHRAKHQDFKCRVLTLGVTQVMNYRLRTRFAARRSCAEN